VWGDTGVGKTFCARRHYGGALYKLRMPQPGDIIRWDGYRQGVHRAVLIDEFRSQVSIETFNDWTDPWPFDGRTFGGIVTIRPSVFIINANTAPEFWWKGEHQGSEIFRAFKRRWTFCSGATSRAHVLEHYDRVAEIEAADAREDEEARERVAKAEADRLQLAELALEFDNVTFPEIDWDQEM